MTKMNSKCKRGRNLLSQYLLFGGVVTSLVVVDQLIKIWVKTHMFKHESIRIANWFYISFIENNGMAFGVSIGPKVLLTSIRLFLFGYLCWFAAKWMRRGISRGFLICIMFVAAGAVGNIIDCLLYGLIFSNPPAPYVAEFVPFGTGYSTWFQGRVVDMFYFPLIEFNWPQALPLIGGQHFVFFSPVFNFADACITCGAIAILLFYRETLVKVTTKEETV
jgi:signal peptidase II